MMDYGKTCCDTVVFRAVEVVVTIRSPGHMDSSAPGDSRVTSRLPATRNRQGISLFYTRFKA